MHEAYVEAHKAYVEAHEGYVEVHMGYVEVHEARIEVHRAFGTYRNSRNPLHARIQRLCFYQYIVLVLLY